MDYVAAEAEKMGLAEFEADNRALSLRLFSGETLTERDREMLDYALSSGVYGNYDNRVENGMRKVGGSRLRYALNRFFVPISKKSSRYVVFANDFGRFKVQPRQSCTFASVQKEVPERRIAKPHILDDDIRTLAEPDHLRGTPPLRVAHSAATTTQMERLFVECRPVSINRTASNEHIRDAYGTDKMGTGKITPHKGLLLPANIPNRPFRRIGMGF